MPRRRSAVGLAPWKLNRTKLGDCPTLHAEGQEKVGFDSSCFPSRETG